jgi:PAS domain S-box-containing protein
LVKEFSVAMVVTLGATGLRYLLDPALGSRGPLMFHLLAVAVAAQIAGTVSGLLVTGFSVILVGHAAPPSDIHMPTVLTIFGLVGSFVSVFGGRQKRLKEELKNACERLALKQQVARMGSYEWFVPAKRIEWSPEAEQIFGIGNWERRLAIEDWTRVIHPEDVDLVVTGMKGCGRPTCDLTYRIVRPDGDVRWVHSRCKFTYDGKGDPLHVIGIIVDVTDLKRGEMAQEILGGLLHICSACRRIQDDEQWYSMEGYLRRHSAAKFSHGMCPDCGKQWYPETAARQKP